jgi:hypothetical protein
MNFGVTPFDGLPLPASVTVYEVGPRDGLQNESIVLPAGIKAEFVERLVDAGQHRRRDRELRASEVGATACRRRGGAAVTGIDLQKMVDTSVWLARQLGRPSPSRTVTALAG